MKWTLILVIAFITLLACQSEKRKVPDGIMRLPKIEVLLTDSSTIFSTAQLKKDVPVILFYFDPDCHTCQEETRMLTKHIHDLNGAEIVFLGIAPTSALKKFSNDYNLERYPTITVAKDHKYSLINTFKLKGIPSMVIYNEAGRLVKIVEGGASVEDIRNWIKI